MDHESGCVGFGSEHPVLPGFVRFFGKSFAYIRIRPLTLAWRRDAFGEDPIRLVARAPSGSVAFCRIFGCFWIAGDFYGQHLNPAASSKDTGAESSFCLPAYFVFALLFTKEIKAKTERQSFSIFAPSIQQPLEPMKPTRIIPLVCPIFLALLSLVETVSGQVTPTQVAQVEIGGSSAQGVAASGNYVYLALDSYGLAIYTASTPSSAVPGYVGSIDNNGGTGFSLDVAISGTHAYLANEGDGLRIYDVSTPANPNNIGYVSDTNISNGYAYGVATSGNYAYVANGMAGLLICNVSNPASPVIASSTTNSSGFAYGVAASGTYAYLANGSDGLRIYNVSNPSNPTNVGHINNGGSARAVVISGHYAYLANYSDGLRIYDISNPANPINIGHTNNGGSAYGVTVAGNYAFLANGGDGLRIYSISNPANPSNVGHASQPVGGAFAYGVAVSGNYAYLADGSEGLLVYSLMFPPQLNITSGNTNSVVISWPSASTGFRLQQKSSLGTTNWATVTNIPAVTNGQNQVIISPSTGNAFYRLISP